MWRCQCHCGKITVVASNNLKRAKSCGCLKGWQGPMPEVSKAKLRESRSSIKTGNRYGFLTALERSPSASRPNKNVVYWRCQCDCGQLVDIPNKKLTGLGQGQSGKPHNLHCGGEQHGKLRLRYPPTPVPYPEEAGAIAQKYLYMLKRFDKDRDAYDIAHDRFMRACFVAYWRSRYGKSVGDEKRYIAKSVRYSVVEARKKRAANARGGVLYDDKGRKVIGGHMANSTMTVEAVIETLPKVLLPKLPPKKPQRFRRC